MKRLLILGLTALLYSSAFVQAGASFRAFPVSVFRAAGFSPRGFSLFDGPRRAADAAYENGKCSSVTGLAGTGVTADVMFSYSATDDHNAVITVAITNTPPFSSDTAGAFISAFAFNLPTSGMMISSIGGDVDDVGSQAATALVSPNEFGWFARYDIGGIKTPNSAGFYDFGVMNHNNVQAFIIDGTGSPTASQILSGETTTFTLAVTGSG